MFILVLLNTKSSIKWSHRCSHIKIYYGVYKKKLDGYKNQKNGGKEEKTEYDSRQRWEKKVQLRNANMRQAFGSKLLQNQC